MTSPLCILGVALTTRQVGVVVLSLERLECHELFALDGRRSPAERLAFVLRAHAPRFVAVTASSHRLAGSPLVRAVQTALAGHPVTFHEHATLRPSARRAGLPAVNRARARAYADRYPSLRTRVPPHPPLRALRTPFERHHEPVFRALLAADLLLRERLTLELPLPYEAPPLDPAGPRGPRAPR